MALKHKGELEVELGLGLPRLTTAQRTAYTPPSEGYQVFDTDLKRKATHDGTDWILSAPAFNLGDKVNSQDGVVRNSFSVNNNADETTIVIYSEAEAKGPAEIDSTRIGFFRNDPYTVTLSENNTKADVTGVSTSTRPAIIKGASVTHVTSGKWYWETVFTGSSSGLSVGILDLTQELITGNTTLGMQQGNAITLNNTTVPYANGKTIGYKASGDAHRFNEVSGENDRAPILPVATARQYNSSALIRHLLDMDAGTYTVSKSATNTSPTFGDEVIIATGIVGPVCPAAAIGSNTSVKFRFSSTEQFYSTPAGYSTFTEFSESTEGSPGTSIKTAAGVTEFNVGLDSTANLKFEDLVITSTTPVLGVDSADAASFVTRASLEDATKLFTESFLVGGWTNTGGVNTIEYTAATHGLPVTGDPYEIIVYELVSGAYKSVSIDHSTSVSTGNVTIATTGAPFDGQIKIS